VTSSGAEVISKFCSDCVTVLAVHRRLDFGYTSVKVDQCKKNIYIILYIQGGFRKS